MELRQVIETAQDLHKLTQNELAKRIGMTKENLSSVLNGRRPLPATAAIELFDLTGIHPRDILNATVTKKPRSGQGLKAACIALACVILTMTTGENKAYASEAYKSEITVTHILALIRSLRRALLKQLARTFGGGGMLRTA